MNHHLRLRWQSILTAGTLFFASLTANAASMTLAVDGFVTYGLNEGLAPNSRPYFAGADAQRVWVGLPIYVEWTIHSQWAPTDQCTNPSNTSYDRFLGCYWHSFGSDALGGTSPNSTGQPFIELRTVVLGSGDSSFRLEIPPLELLPLRREDERVDVHQYPDLQGFNVYDSITRRDTPSHMFTADPYPWSASIRTSHLSFVAHDFLVSDELVQAFDVTSVQYGTGFIRFTDFSSICALTAGTGQIDCSFSRDDEGAVLFAPTRVRAWFVPEPSIISCLLWGAIALLVVRGSRSPAIDPGRVAGHGRPSARIDDHMPQVRPREDRNDAPRRVPMVLRV